MISVWWFQQDEATPHFANDTIQVVNENTVELYQETVNVN